MAEFGVLCHVTCLNNRYGLGDFGKSAYKFVDFLKKIGASVWEVLPLNLANDFNCPYGAMSVFSFDEMFVDLEELCDFGLLEKKQLACLTQYKNSKKVEFSKIKPKKFELFECAYKNLKSKEFLDKFEKDDAHVFEYAYWRALREVFGENDWHFVDKKFWKLDSKDARRFVAENKEVFQKYIFFQYVLQKQWHNLKDYANKNGIKIFGDVPAYCDRASVEVFAHPKYVKLDKNFLPSATGGAPADNVDIVMQDWGTCVYDWEKLSEENFDYLIDRVKTLLERYDLLRLDHFMAYDEHFEIPKNGKDQPRFERGGGENFFEALGKNVSLKNIIVEDIGTMTNHCKKVQKKFDLAGMNVLQYAFDTDEKNPHLPDNVKDNVVYYTETHDNNTFMGFLKKLNDDQLDMVEKFLGCQNRGLKQTQIEAVKKVLASKAKIAIIPIQDLMFLDERFRMNIAGVAAGCWEYRLQKNFERMICGNVRRYFKKV